MAATVKAYEKKLLKNGTLAGPVTQEMIDFCKEEYSKVSPNKDKWGWTDFLGIARERMKNENIRK